jgi:hypothetical protein
LNEMKWSFGNEFKILMQVEEAVFRYDDTCLPSSDADNAVAYIKSDTTNKTCTHKWIVSTFTSMFQKSFIFHFYTLLEIISRKLRRLSTKCKLLFSSTINLIITIKIIAGMHNFIVVNCRLQKTTVNLIKLCYATVLSSVSCNNRNLFKFRYAVAL